MSVQAQRATVAAEARPMLTRAWIIWGLLVLVGAVLLVWTASSLPAGSPALRDHGAAGVGLFLAACGVLLVLAPLAYLMRSHVFRASWTGRAVEPRSYLRGLGTVWAVLAAAVVLGLVSVWVGHTLLPGLLPAGLAWLLLLPVRPDGDAVARG
jgi:hypothetical protein